MENKIREIRIQLRRAMNGEVAASMREKGVVYKLNFGVSLPRLQEMAAIYGKDLLLAERLWIEDVREMKILAILVLPLDHLALCQAEQWAMEIRHQEITELYTMHVLQYLPYAGDLADKWISKGDRYLPVMGFLLYGRLFMKNRYPETPERKHRFFMEARKVLDRGLSRLQRAVMTALRRYGRKDPELAEEVLNLIKDYPSSGDPEKVEFYNDLKFEFEYYP